MEIREVLEQYEISVEFLENLKSGIIFRGKNLAVHGISTHTSNGIKIKIEDLLDRKEKIITFLHEVLHSDPKFDESKWPGYCDLERAITGEAIRIYNSDPELIKYVEEKYLSLR